MTTRNEDDYNYDSVPSSEEGNTFNLKSGNITIQLPNTMSLKNTTNFDGRINRKFLYLAACTGNLAAFTCGISFGWTSPEIPLLKLNDSTNPLSYPLTINEESWIGSLLPVGAILGPFIAGIAADKVGRKKTLLVGIIPFIIGFSMAAFANHCNLFYIVRFLFGLGVGCIFTVLPMYIGEIADDDVRGALGSFMQLFITFGLLFSYGLGPFISIKQFNIACVSIPVLFLIIFLLFIPESPYYLIKNDNYDGAEVALMRLRHKSKVQIQKELNSIRDSVDEAVNNKATFFDIFKSKGLSKALIISLSLVTLQQLSGINIILFYAQDIFTDAGSTLKPEIATIIIGIVQVFASAATPVLVERRGKIFLLLVSAIGMAISQAALAIFFHIKDGSGDYQSIAWLPVVSLICYIITYCLGFGPLPWAVMGELFPGNVKSQASTATASGCWFLAFLLTKYFSFISNIIGKSGSFGFFAVCCSAGAFFVYKYVPETSGKSLQEIQKILNGKN